MFVDRCVPGYLIVYMVGHSRVVQAQGRGNQVLRAAIMMASCACRRIFILQNSEDVQSQYTWCFNLYVRVLHLQ